MKNIFFEKYIKDKSGREKLLIILCVSGILLIFASNYITVGKESKTKAEEPVTVNEADESEEYKKGLERELSEIISSVDGVGKSKIMVTLSNGVEYIYLSDKDKNTVSSEDCADEGNQIKKSTSDNSKESIILVDNGEGGKEALIRTRIEPSVKGVLIVCEGGNDNAVAEKVTEIVASLLNISTRKISVSKLS